jgi:hypothetical protein
MAHLFNIGLDFGTAFTKCVIRDRAGNHYPLVSNRARLGLYPSVVCMEQGHFTVPEESESDYPNGFHGLKMALFQSLRGQRNDPWITQLGSQWANFRSDEVQLWVERLISLFLGVMIQRAKAFIKLKQPDFGDDAQDGLQIMMAIPCAHAADRILQETYLSCLEKGNFLSQYDLQDITWEQLSTLLTSTGEKMNYQVFCEVYPEATANMGAFVNSRAGRPGLYVLADVGAGTVDCSIFIYRQGTIDNRDFTYLHVDVMPLGSSRIEALASHYASTDLRGKIRQAKEGIQTEDRISYQLTELLRTGMNEVKQQLALEIGQSLSHARQKLFGPKQWNDLKVLMAGGGCSLPLYPQCINSTVDHHWHFQPAVENLPCPENLAYPDPANKDAFFRRFSVAYGLSFGVDLPGQRFPSEVSDPERTTEIAASNPNEDKYDQ